MNWFRKYITGKPTGSIGDNVLTDLENKVGSADNAVKSTIAQPTKTFKQNLTIQQLKQFAPLRTLDDISLTTIPHVSFVFKKGSVIFNMGQHSDSVVYLLKGKIVMQPDGESSYEIAAGTPQSFLPLNSGSKCGATATAKTEVEILEISAELNRLWAEKSQEKASCTELVDIQLPDFLDNSQFFNNFTKAYRNNQLQLPSLPNVAFKLNEAMKEDIGIAKAVEIIHIDPPIVAKLIQVANSALYSTGVPISNCYDAVSRIGLDATRNLVMGICLKQLFNCKVPDLVNGMQSLWKNSLYVSSLSFVLAQDCSSINPDDALLAGLIADIGAIPLLHFAEQYSSEPPSFQELQAALPSLRAPVGALVLHTLGFSLQLSNIPHHAENWLYDSGDRITLEDIVILAKLHSYFGTGNTRNLPYINSIPAYCKLTTGKLDPDFSLHILQKAQHRINAVMQLLS